MSEPIITPFWTPRRLMIAALLLHLLSLPLPYSNSTLRGHVTSDRPSSQTIYNQTGSRGLANDSDYGRNWTVSSSGAEAKNGVQWMPASLLILPFLLWAFGSAEPRGGFWARRRGYLVGFGLLLICGGTNSALGGQLALVALALGAYAAYRRYVAPSLTPAAPLAPVPPPGASLPEPMLDAAKPATKRKPRSRAKTPPASD